MRDTAQLKNRGAISTSTEFSREKVRGRKLSSSLQRLNTTLRIGKKVRSNRHNIESHLVSIPNP